MTMFGNILNRVQFERRVSREKAVNDLWVRNGLESAVQREGHKLAETSIVHRDGTESTEYRLYKLIDRSVVTISSKVITTIEEGFDGSQAAKENS